MHCVEKYSLTIVDPLITDLRIDTHPLRLLTPSQLTIFRKLLPPPPQLG